MIETHDLSRKYGPKLALPGLNLRVEPGERFGSIYSNPTSTIVAVVVNVLIGVALDLLTRARVNRQAQLLEFEASWSKRTRRTRGTQNLRTRRPIGIAGCATLAALASRDS